MALIICNIVFQYSRIVDWILFGVDYLWTSLLQLYRVLFKLDEIDTRGIHLTLSVCLQNYPLQCRDLLQPSESDVYGRHILIFKSIPLKD